MFFNRQPQPQQGMSFKTQLFLILAVCLVGYIFRVPILAHFGIELEKSGKAIEGVEHTPKELPETAIINQAATVFLEPGRKPYATLGAGQLVTVLDVEDKGQSYITVRHNGMTGYVARRDLKLNKE